MKVMMVGPYPVHGIATGGVAAVASALVGALARRDEIDLHVVTTAPPGTLARSDGQITMHLVPDSGRWRRLTFYRSERDAITRILREARPEIVHVQGQNFFAAGALTAGLPTVVTLHGMLGREKGIVDRRSRVSERVSKLVRGHFNARFETAVLLDASDLIIINPYVARTIGDRTQARFHAIDNPVDDAFFDVRDAAEPDRLFFAGALEPRKALHQLIEAVGLLCDRGVDVRLRIAGMDADPGYAAALRAAAAQRVPPGAVAFLGVVSQADLLEEYARAALVVMSSVEETSPMLLQQAMAAGKPVVAPRVGGIPDLVDDRQTGRLVPGADPAALADAIAELLGSAPARSALGARGRERAEARFRSSAVAARTCEVYAAILAAGRLPRATAGETRQKSD